MHEYIVASVSDMRLDRYLRTISPSLTQGIIEQALRKKKILLNKKAAKASDRVSARDVLTVDNSLISAEKEEFFEDSPAIRKLADRLRGDLRIFDHKDFFAINKPSNIACQGGTKIAISIDGALKYMGKGLDILNCPRLVHRLDKATSGVLLLAKSHGAAVKLTKAFKDCEIEKEYLAIVRGRLYNKSGIIDGALIKDVASQRQVLSDEDGAKDASTAYEVIHEFVDKNKDVCSLVKFMPRTGRTHQIRAHAASLGHPIVGDNRYGDEESNQHLMLHAHKILIPIHLFGQEFVVRQDMPPYMKSYGVI